MPQGRYPRNEKGYILRKSYETIAIENAQKMFVNPHSQRAYIKGFMEAVDKFVKPKNKSIEELDEDSILK